MTFVSSRESDFLKQRSFWLRCFLSGWLLVVTIGLAHGQLELPKPERLTHVEGIVVSPEGHPVPDIAVKLLRDENVNAETRTDKSGRFEFERMHSGPYVLRVPRTQYAPAARDVVITDEIVTHLERKKLYIILGPGACQDECSAVLTSKRDFERTIRKNKRH
jgi:hypothetical protein